MDESEQRRIALDRIRLKNPYAHLERLTEYGSKNSTSASVEQIRRQRKLLENQYSFLDGDGHFVADDVRSQPSPQRPMARNLFAQRHWRMPDREIEERATKLQREIWMKRARIWDGSPPTNPVDLLKPEIALSYLGFECQFETSLGVAFVNDHAVDVAGLIDFEKQKVRISEKLVPPVQRFTAAHELGHVMLHPGLSGAHRDLPIDRVTSFREARELEADKFATYYLMPAKLVRARFNDAFGTFYFELNEETSFHLVGSSSADVRSRFGSLRALTQFLASAESFAGRHFRSLADQFGVSAKAMAIRIEELGLVEAY